MRILVISDSHGDAASVERALLRHRDADWLIHLGDGYDDLDTLERYLAHMRRACVRGNCDWGCALSDHCVLQTGGKRIYCCHGHREGVKGSLDGLIAKASAQRCEIALYGHTHIQRYEFTDGVHVFNPGSIRGGNYGLIEIDETTGEVRFEMKRV